MTKSRERAFENLMLLMLDNKKVRTESESDDMKSERGVHVGKKDLHYNIKTFLATAEKQ
ncbi:hypothetical protein RUM43_012060 [Polyplax serrata]|uniref:Uncharacterized protein n=1 Tax=Polyplax serrata TaxID=468196 RepID=A0AAN8PJB3_POLSC